MARACGRLPFPELVLLKKFLLPWRGTVGGGRRSADGHGDGDGGGGGQIRTGEWAWVATQHRSAHVRGTDHWHVTASHLRIDAPVGTVGGRMGREGFRLAVGF